MACRLTSSSAINSDNLTKTSGWDGMSISSVRNSGSTDMNFHLS